MRLTRTALAAAGAAALLAGTAATATAASPSTVTVGGSTSGTTSYSAHTTGSVAFAAGGVSMGCTGATAAGSVTAGSAAWGTAFATIASSTWSGCTGPLSIPMTVTQTAPWGIAITGNTSGNITPGSITGVAARVASTTPGLCSFDVTGSIAGNFDDRVSTAAHAHNGQLLNVTGPSTLTVSNVSGCFGLIPNGSAASFGASFHVTNAANTAELPIDIS